jgi:hypothetical protein
VGLEYVYCSLHFKEKRTAMVLNVRPTGIQKNANCLQNPNNNEKNKNKAFIHIQKQNINLHNIEIKVIKKNHRDKSNNCLLWEAFE